MKQVLVCHYKLSITPAELSRLDWSPTLDSEKRYLDDKIIDMYMQILMHNRKSDAPKVFVFDSYFFESYERRGYEQVKGYTRNKDIFSYGCVFIPMALDEHWVMIILDFLKKEIIFFDSLCMIGEKKRNIILDKIRAYLEEESKRKQSISYDGREMEVVVNKYKIQSNAYDCGVFCCMKARCHVLEPKVVISQRHMAYARLLMATEILGGQIILCESADQVD